MRQPYLKEVPSAIRLTVGFINSLIRRIECTKPLAGKNINISEKDDGIQISTQDLTSYTLNICKNGEPDTLEVYGPDGQ